MLAEVQALQVFLYVLLALVVDVWLVQQLKSLNHNLQTLFKAFVSDFSEFPSEGLQDFNCCVAEISIAQ